MGRMRAQIAFLRKFAHFYDSGVALAEALRLARGEIDDEFGEAVESVIDDIYRGNSLADALEARPHIFSGDVVALIRVGEQRGDISGAARSAADGLGGGVLDGALEFEEEVEALLMMAGDAIVLHVSPDGELRVRDADGLHTLEDRAPPGAIDGTLVRAGLAEREAGASSFVWQDRLVRVAAAPTGDFVSLVLRISGDELEEPATVAEWRAGPPRLLVVHGARYADFDGTLRAIARAFDAEGTVRVAVDLPVPELLAADDIESGLALDPDVLIACRVGAGDVARIREAVESGVRVVVAARSLGPFEALDPVICSI